MRDLPVFYRFDQLLRQSPSRRIHQNRVWNNADGKATPFFRVADGEAASVVHSAPAGVADGAVYRRRIKFHPVSAQSGEGLRGDQREKPTPQ